MDIIGREKEIKQLNRVLESRKSEFVAIYGRRRVGKTYLVREYFAYTFDFQMTGMANSTTKGQLHNFFSTLQNQSTLFFEEEPKTWFDAFQLLIQHLESIKKEGKIVLFIDELPWFDTPNADFLTGLEHFWNAWATNRKDILLITCGSAASWIVKKILNNHGGLHNRVTERIKMEPFNLYETELFLQSKGGAFNRYQIVQLYMVMGGIPFYLDGIQVDKSAAQNIEEMCFRKSGFLVIEYRNLFASLFKKPYRYEAIIEELASKTIGLSRDEIAQAAGFSRGGTLTALLNDLEESGFIQRYTPFNKKNKGAFYRLSDFYSAFYFKFIKENTNYEQGAWVNALDQPKQRAWHGYAYEQIYLYHIQQIKKALGIHGVYSQSFSWRSAQNEAQVDLLIDRRDQVVNVCEVKFNQDEFEITKSYAEKLRNKVGIFRQETQTRKSVFLTMITTFGVKNNIHKGGLVQNEVTMYALFEEG